MSGPMRDEFLLLVPTEFERRELLELGGFDAPLELCGFGPVSAAARTAQLLAGRAARRVLLIGIAGSLDAARAPVGSAHRFGRVRLDGVGAGSGSGFLPPSRLGFAQWGEIEETLELTGEEPAELLSVCAAAATAEEARARGMRYPAAWAEDMEGFGVALACRLFGRELTVVRGVSNLAGDRDTSHWQVGAALRAAHELVQDGARRHA